MNEDEVYVHGTDRDERHRLGLMNELINPGCLRELALATGDSVLEVGAGLCHFARAMAGVVGASGRVLAIERDETQLREGRRLNAAADPSLPVELRAGDAAVLPLTDDERGTFDVAHARFLLEHVADPAAAVSQMMTAVRPGGRVAVADDDHEMLRVWPESPGFVELWSAYIRLQDRLGHDPLVGRRLVSLLHDAGAEAIRTALVFYGGCASMPAFGGLVDNLIGVFMSTRARLIENGLYDGPAFNQVLASIDLWRRRPDAALWYSISWADGRRPRV